MKCGFLMQSSEHAGSVLVEPSQVAAVLHQRPGPALMVPGLHPSFLILNLPLATCLLLLLAALGARNLTLLFPRHDLEKVIFWVQ